jgi:hypothetical protein
VTTMLRQTLPEFGLVCPTDSYRTTEREARFCKKCGRVLRHPCPHCQRLIDAGSAAASPLTRCPVCREALWQCRDCRWVARIGTTRCVNPHCSPDSLQAAQVFSVVGGDPGRSSEYRWKRSSAAASRVRDGLSVAPLLGKAISVVAGLSSFIALMDEPELRTLDTQELLLGGAAVVPEARRVMLPFRPKAVSDALAACGDTQLYVLGCDAAFALDLHPDEVHVREQVQGKFVAQVVTAAGWFLAETTSEGPRFHRRNLDSSDRGVPPEKFPSQLEDPCFLLPVASATHIYWADAEGQAWGCAWEGGRARKIGSPTGLASTCMLAAGDLFVLPVLRQGHGRRVRLTTFEEEKFPVGERMPLAAALAGGAQAKQLWLGSNSPPCVTALNRDLISSRGMTPRISNPVQQLCTVHVSAEKTAILAVLSDVGGLYVQGWRAESPYFGLQGLHARSLSKPARGGRMVISEPWVLFWYASDQETSMVLNCLTCIE